MLDTADIRLLTTIATHGSLVRAGRVLGITQSGLTRALAALEARLRTRLFDRSRHGLEPTEVCRAIIARGSAILDAMNELNDSVTELRASGGALALTCAPCALDTAVLPAAARFLAAYPKVKLTLRGEGADAVRNLRDRKVEIAVAELSDLDTPAEFRITPLRRHPLLLLVRTGHPLTRLGRPPEPRDILVYPTVAPGMIPARIALFVARVRADTRLARDAQAFPAAATDLVSAGLAMAARSDALTAATAASAAAALRAGCLVALPYRAPWLVTNLGILSLRGRPLSAPAEAMVELLQAADAESFGHAKTVAPHVAQAFPEEMAVVGELLAPSLVAAGGVRPAVA
jgi:DNA-binding transcriptional LysR family regulator